MDNILGVYVTATLVSAVVSAVVAVFALRRRHVPGAGALSAMMFAAAFWCATYAGELLATSEVAKSLWARSEYLGADVALYAAKELAEGVAEYDPPLDAGDAEILDVLAQARAALRDDG